MKKQTLVEESVQQQKEIMKMQKWPTNVKYYYTQEQGEQSLSPNQVGVGEKIFSEGNALPTRKILSIVHRFFNEKYN
jgi:hypothetical protein